MIGSVCGHVLYAEIVNKTHMHTLAVWADNQTEIKPHHLGASGIGCVSYMESVACLQLVVTLYMAQRRGSAYLASTMQDKNAVKRT